MTTAWRSSHLNLVHLTHIDIIDIDIDIDIDHDIDTTYHINIMCLRKHLAARIPMSRCA